MLNPSLVILYEDSDCLAVAKPAGQFTQGNWAPPGETTLETAIRRHLNPADPESVYLGTVHRLDRPTSGVLLWAKTAKAARRLSSQFEKRQVVKEYWAIVAPGLPGQGFLDEPPPDRVRQCRGARGNLVRLADPSEQGRPGACGRSRNAAIATGRDPGTTHPSGRLADRVRLATTLAQDRPDPSTPGPGRRAGDADPGRCRVWVGLDVRCAAHHRAPCPIAASPAPHPSDPDGPRRAHPTRMALLGGASR